MALHLQKPSIHQAINSSQFIENPFTGRKFQKTTIFLSDMYKQNMSEENLVMYQSKM